MKPQICANPICRHERKYHAQQEYSCWKSDSGMGRGSKRCKCRKFMIQRGKKK